jgi:hypothetical protein
MPCRHRPPSAWRSRGRYGAPGKLLPRASRTLTSALRLVTFGGSFDPATGHYRANSIVFATIRT